MATNKRGGPGVRRRFIATHEMTLTRVGGVRETAEVMLVDGAVYTQEEWTRGAAPAWRYGKIGWKWRDGVKPPPGYVWPPEAHRIGRGSDPKRGTPGKNRTIRVPDAIWERFQAAAEKQDTSVADWLIEAGELALARGSTR